MTQTDVARSKMIDAHRCKKTQDASECSCARCEGAGVGEQQGLLGTREPGRVSVVSHGLREDVAF